MERFLCHDVIEIQFCCIRQPNATVRIILIIYCIAIIIICSCMCVMVLRIHVYVRNVYA